MIRALYIAKIMETIGDTLVTVLFAGIIIGAHDTLAIIASCLAIIYWIPKIKREVFRYHGGSVWDYFKNFFKKDN